jgi:hypothetical protein
MVSFFMCARLQSRYVQILVDTTFSFLVVTIHLSSGAAADSMADVRS